MKNDFVVSIQRHGLGDEIARIPAILSLYKEGLTPTIISRRSMIEIIQQFFPKEKVVTYDEYKSRSDLNKILGISVENDSYPTSLSTHLVDHGFMLLSDRLPENDLERSYPRVTVKSWNASKPHVVICTDHTAPNRQFPSEYINPLCDWIISKGLLPVYLGGKAFDTQPTFTAKDLTAKGRLDLRGQTTLIDCLEIISTAKAVIGVDGGLIHLAGLTNTPIIAGYTSVDPKYRMPYRNGKLGDRLVPVIPDQNLNCKFCQNTKRFEWDHDYRTCFYDHFNCVKQLTPAKWAMALEVALSWNHS